MRGRLALALAGLVAVSCAHRPPGFRVPESAIRLSDRPPGPPSPPPNGAFDSDAARPIRLIVRCGGDRRQLEATCRVGVWTTLESVRPVSFALRESWGALGDRPPRLLAQVRDDFPRGVIARVRPERDGSLAWRVEVSDGDAGPPRPVGVFRGRTIELPRPRRHGYRFASRLPAGFLGAAASWEGGPSVHVGEEAGPAAPAGALRFDAEGARGFVAGSDPEAEAFDEEWIPVEPLLLDFDGVERADFRTAPKRRAAGFRPGARGAPQPFGGRDLEFRFSRAP